MQDCSRSGIARCGPSSHRKHARTPFDFRQAYLQVGHSKTTNFLCGKARSCDSATERLIGISDWDEHQPHPFDVIPHGDRQILTNRLDLFSGSVVARFAPNELDTYTRAASTFHGAYANAHHSSFPLFGLEPYVLMKTPNGPQGRQGILGRRDARGLPAYGSQA